jgi:hypothetical protein
MAHQNKNQAVSVNSQKKEKEERFRNKAGYCSSPGSFSRPEEQQWTDVQEAGGEWKSWGKTIVDGKTG